MTERTTIMGMSASQARFLCLTARKNNVEFEGQQINQQRTSLSNESGSYYSELCNMSVPTPPSIDDYTKVTYTFDDGALTNTITSMIAKGANSYSISYIQQWQDDYSIVSASSSVVSRKNVALEGEPEQYEYRIGSAMLRKMDGSFANGTIKTEDIQAMSDEDYEEFQKSDSIKNDKYLSSLTKDQLVDLIEQESYYKSMLNEKNGTKEDYYVRYVKDSQTGGYTPFFYKENDLEKSAYIDGELSESLGCYTIGSATKTREVLNQEGIVEKDSTGRYLSITLFDKDENGNKIGNGIQYNLITNTSTDEAAYNDAMNKYNYEQHQYNQKVQDINSKIEIVQQQDKSLELKLKQLDTERTAIDQEAEAVKAVIKKNVELSFKTFNA
ncbi:MAG: hypothetical protein NC191_06210 [Muribaculaceae bacterium]|nr:hypothetical protein [Muribaculaceae bacterium]